MRGQLLRGGGAAGAYFLPLPLRRTSLVSLSYTPPLAEKRKSPLRPPERKEIGEPEYSVTWPSICGERATGASEGDQRAKTRQGGARVSDERSALAPRLCSRLRSRPAASCSARTHLAAGQEAEEATGCLLGGGLLGGRLW